MLIYSGLRGRFFCACLWRIACEVIFPLPDELFLKLILGLFSTQALDGVAGFAAYIFGPLLPRSGVTHAVGNSMEQFVDEGVADRFFGVVQGVSGDFYIVFIF